MKIYSPIGSKQRLFEMMRGVNKAEIYENNGIDNLELLEEKINELKTKKLTIKNSNIQASGNESFIELNCTDNQENLITFRFKAIAQEEDQQDTYNVSDVLLIEFDLKNENSELNVNIHEDSLKEFNANHKDELLDIVSQYADFESNTKVPELDETFLDAVKKIDSYPFGGTPRKMKLSKAYGNEQPTNPDVRVKSDELDKFVDESVDTISADDIIKKYYNKLPEAGTKEEIIRIAQYIFQKFLKAERIDINSINQRDYRNKIKEISIELFGKKIASLNESDDYPKEIGKKFKAKKQYKDEKKKKETSITIGEGSNDGMNYEPDIDQIEQLSQEKEKNGEVLVGGKGDGKSPLEFDPKQIKMGLKVEMEHTKDPLIAIEIVLDHLSEDSEYYTVKDDPETSAQANASTEAENEIESEEDSNKNMEDILLGYKSKNVGDEVTDSDEHINYNIDEIKA